MSEIKTSHVDTLNTFATSVCTHLGAGWLVSRPAGPETPSGCIITDGTRQLHLYWPAYPRDAKVTVSGIYEDGRSGRDERPKIGVSITRDAKQVAGDIARRFLPAHDAATAKVSAEIAADTKANDERAAAIATVAAELGREPHNGGALYFTSDTARADMDTNHNGTSWELKLHVPTELAAAIARLIRDS